MWNVPGKERLGTASPTGGDPRLDLPSWDGFSCGLWSVEGLLSPQGHFPTSPIPPQIGVLPPTLASVWGGLPGAPWPLLPLLPPPYLCPGLRGAFCLFFFFYLGVFVLSPSSVCFQRCCWADGQGRGLSAHPAQGSEKGTPRASGDQLQYCTSWPVARGPCNSRGRVTPSTMASAPPAALPPHSTPPTSHPVPS